MAPPDVFGGQICARSSCDHSLPVAVRAPQDGIARATVYLRPPSHTAGFARLVAYVASSTAWVARGHWVTPGRAATLVREEARVEEATGVSIISRKNPFRSRKARAKRHWWLKSQDGTVTD